MVNVIENKSIELLKELNEYKPNRTYIHEIPNPIEEDFIFTGKLVRVEQLIMFKRTSKLSIDEYNLYCKVYTALKHMVEGTHFTPEEQTLLLHIISTKQIPGDFSRAIKFINRRLRLEREEIKHWMYAIDNHFEKSFGLEEASNEVKLYIFDDGLNECKTIGNLNNEIEVGKVYNVRINESKYTGDEYVIASKEQETYYDLDGFEEIKKEDR